MLNAGSGVKRGSLHVVTYIRFGCIASSTAVSRTEILAVDPIWAAINVWTNERLMEEGVQDAMLMRREMNGTVQVNVGQASALSLDF